MMKQGWIRGLAARCGIAAGALLIGMGANCQGAGDCPASGPVPGESCLATFETSIGELRTYRIHVPAGHDTSTGPMPLLYNITGLGRADDVYDWGTGMSEASDTEGFLLVYPESINQWRQGAEVGKETTFLIELLDQLEATYSIDPARVFATGISSGGGMAHVLACDHADRFAAVGAVAPVNTEPDYPCEPSRAVPFLIMIGGQDDFVQWPDGGGNPLLEAPRPFAEGWAARNAATDYSETPGPILDLFQWQRPFSPDGDVTVMLGHELGHWWPTVGHSGFDGTTLFLDFFDAHPMP